MRLIYLDDAKQRKDNCIREFRGDAVGVGGVMCDASVAFEVEAEIDRACEESGFPEGETFKWSPGKGSWLHSSLVNDERRAFFEKVISIVLEADGKFCVVVLDRSYKTASGAHDHELDALTLCLERFDNAIPKDERAIAIVAKPSGGKKDEKQLLEETKKLRKMGTDYSSFSKIGMNLITMPFDHSRLLQVADLVTSSVTALISGSERYSRPIFDALMPGLLKNAFGMVGGIGMKVHPDFVYENLYYWILREDLVVPDCYELPRKDRPFAASSFKRKGTD